MVKSISILFLLVFGAVCYGAQTESVTIGPGDLLHIKVLEAPEMEQTARVTDSGAVPLIIGGDVKVAGLIPSEAAHAIAQRLIGRKYFLNPHVSVSIDMPATQNVTVMGQVHTPGSYPISTPRSVIEVLALAGGLTEVADRHITIERHATGEKIDYVYTNGSDRALADSVRVFPGDIINIPKAGVVYVLGDVKTPGGFTMATNTMKLSVLQAVALAGGTQPTAVPSHARLIRKSADGYVTIEFSLSAMQKGRRADMQLRPDDIIYIPFSYLRNIAVGATSLVAAAASASIYRY